MGETGGIALITRLRGRKGSLLERNLCSFSRLRSARTSGRRAPAPWRPLLRGSSAPRSSRASPAGSWKLRLRSTAARNAASFAFEGLLKPLTFLTNCSEAARISTSVTGGSKLKSVLMFLHIGVTSMCRGWLLLLQWRASQRPLKPGDVMPFSELAPHGLGDPDGFEAQAPVQCDTTFIGHGDACVRVAETLAGKVFQQPLVQGAPHALAVMIRMHVGGHFDRPAICGTLAMGGTVGVADALPGSFGKQPLPTSNRLCDPGGELVRRRRDGFERDGGGLHERPIDGEKGR